MTPEDIALSRAKVQLMRIPDTIFYTTILLSLKQSWETKLPTAATNGTNLLINPDWFLGLPEKERIGLLVHELLHVALDHMSRLKDRHPKVWNAAADHVINLSILATNNYELPKGGLWDKRFKDMSTEQVYKILWEEAEDDKANGGPGADGMMIPGGSDIQFPETAEELSVVERDVAEIVQRACITAKGANEKPGDLPGEVQIRLEEVLNPKLPWHVILQNHLSSFAKNDYSWKKPNRRYAPEFHLPSAYSESAGHIAEAFDISGSVSPEEVSYYVGETSSLMEMLKPDKITVISFDTEIQNIQEVTADSDIYSELELVGGGGTCVREILQWAIDNNPEVFLIFTDGQFQMPDEKYYPNCPVVWLVHENKHFTAPFGTVIHYDIGD